MNEKTLNGWSRSTFTFTCGLSYIASISFTPADFTCVRKEFLCSLQLVFVTSRSRLAGQILTCESLSLSFQSFLVERLKLYSDLKMWVWVKYQ